MFVGDVAVAVRLGEFTCTVICEGYALATTAAQIPERPDGSEAWSVCTELVAT
jgi:hypothetical protein